MTDLAVAMCDPRAREREIKDLFARNGKPEFDDVFERAYRVRVEHGMRSWVGLIDGRVVMHISVTPIPFLSGDRSVNTGLLGDLMVDADYRDFWGPVRLLRTMVGDLRNLGSVDCLLTTSNADAESIFKAGGFKPFGTLRRFVLPLYLPYLGMARLRGRVTRHRARATSFHASMYKALAGSSDCGGRCRPRAEAEYYETRLPRAEFTDGTWIEVTQKRGSVSGSALVSRSDVMHEMALADVFWDGHGVRFGDVVHAAAQYARAQRFRKLTISTLQESQVAQQLENAGFFARDIRSTLLVNRLRSQDLPPVEEWFLPGFALSSW